MPGVEDLDLGHPLLQHGLGGSLVALEREGDIRAGHRLPIVEHRILPQHEVVAEPVLGCRPRLGQARRLHLPRHRLHHGVMQRIHDHERGDDADGLGGVEPGGSEGDVHSPGQLALRRRSGPRDTEGAGRHAGGARCDQLPPRQPKPAGLECRNPGRPRNPGCPTGRAHDVPPYWSRASDALAALYRDVLTGRLVCGMSATEVIAGPARTELQNCRC